VSGDLEGADQERVSGHLSELSHSGLWVKDEAGLSTAEIVSIARQQQEDHGLRLVVVDSLSLLTGPYPDAIEAATLDLKKLATTLRITVLATIGFSGWKVGELPRRALEQSGFLEHSDIVVDAQLRRRFPPRRRDRLRHRQAPLPGDRGNRDSRVRAEVRPVHGTCRARQQAEP
jgi:replicative DNA helicase